MLDMPWTYEIYFDGMMLVALLVLSARWLRSCPTRWIRTAIVISWTLLAAWSVSYRSVKLLVLVGTWSARNPELLYAFVRQNIPPGAIVLGNDDYSFYAVLKAGNEFVHTRYVFAIYDSVDPDNVRQYVARQLTLSRPVYLIWPHTVPVPSDFSATDLHLIGTFRSDQSTSMLRRLSALNRGGYPNTDLYVIRKRE
jgi:hypothetical protein